MDGAQPGVPQRIVPVLAGGGGRLPAHIGVLQALAELGVDYHTLVGVSGGSIVGALIAAGHTLPAVQQIARDTDFSQFARQNLVSLLRTGGLSSGDSFQQWLDDLLEGRCFGDLELDFHVVATDVRSGEPVIFNRDSHPQMPVALAVRFSMSVPILFSFKEYGEHLMVDGSILSEDSLQRNWSGDGTPVVVFKLRSSSSRARRDHRLVPLRGYLEMLIRTFMIALSREYISEDFWLSTIVIDAGDISPMDLKLSAEDKERLYAAGYDTTREVLPAKLARRQAAGGAGSAEERRAEDGADTPGPA